MNFIILDLEWNGAFSKKERKFVNEIIEFGAVKLDETLAVTETFSMLVTPQIGKKLNGKIEELTHLTNEDLKGAHNTFMHVASLFSRFSADSVILTWGRSDIHTLMENFVYYEKKPFIPFLKKYCDLQMYCAKSLDEYDKSKQMGLSTCAQHLGIDREEFTLHRATDDARLSALCFKQLYNEKKFAKFVENCDDEFYRKMTFRTAYITDINNPLIDRSKMQFICPTCNNPAKRVTPWVVKNRQFRANFRCKECKTEFSGRIAFRLKYEGLQINKRIVKLLPPEENIKVE